MKNESPKNSSRYLQEARVKVLPNLHCENMLYDLLKMKLFVFDKYLCSKGEPQVYLDYVSHIYLGVFRLIVFTLLYNSQGDSGGPVLSKNSVVAINGGVCPREDSCNLPTEVINEHQFNFHTKVNFYKNFINDVLKNY